MLLNKVKAFIIILTIALPFSTKLLAQSIEREAISKFQKQLSEEYSNPQTSPLSKSDLSRFKGHDFFPIDLKYRVTATLMLTPNATYFKMQTSTNQPKDHRMYAIASFTIEGNRYKLPVYQSHDLMKTEMYKDYLFLPFTDVTNGEQTYSGGRYIDLKIPAEGNVITIDFNQAYNPCCAHSKNYSCPVVPQENELDVAIEAGIRYRKKK
jgi:uncharacterized protein